MEERKEGERKGGESKVGLARAGLHWGTISLQMAPAPWVPTQSTLTPATRNDIPAPSSTLCQGPPGGMPASMMVPCLPMLLLASPGLCIQKLGHWVARHLSRLPPCPCVPSWVSLRSGSPSSSPVLPSCPSVHRPVREKSRCLWTLREKLRAAGPAGLPGTGGSTLSTWAFRLR